MSQGRNYQRWEILDGSTGKPLLIGYGSRADMLAEYRANGFVNVVCKWGT